MYAEVFCVNKKLFRTLELWGIPVVFLMASFLHGIYEWSGRSVLGALVGAVNESVWEHLKIFAEAYLIWAAVELLWVNPPFRKFVVAKTLCVCFLLVFITVFFYTYTLFTKRAYLALDIGASFLFVVLSQLLSLKLMQKNAKLEKYFPLAIMMLVLIFVMVLCFSYYPPRIFLFRDNVTGGFGVKAREMDGAFRVLCEKCDFVR